jgi:hypothetical protein
LDRRRSISLRLALRWFSLSLLLAAAILTALKYREYQNLEAVFPKGSTLGGIPVGGLDLQQGMERLEQAYGIPVALLYGESTIHLNPTQAGFEIEMEELLAAARQAGLVRPGLPGFLDYLFGLPPAPVDLPLQASVDPERLHDYLVEEVASRYDRQPVPALPYPGTVHFIPGTDALILDVERALPQVESRPALDQRAQGATAPTGGRAARAELREPGNPAQANPRAFRLRRHSGALPA